MPSIRQLFLVLVLPLLALPGGLRVALCLCGPSIELAPACCSSSGSTAGPSVASGEGCCDACGELTLPEQVSRLLERAEADALAACLAFVPAAFAFVDAPRDLVARPMHRDAWRAPPWAAPATPLRL
jgi:hypothetical protein